MADYYTRFSVMLPLGSADRIAPALAIYAKLAEDLDRDEEAAIGFEAAASPEVDPAALWLSAEEDGNPEHVITFVRLCGEAFGLTGRWGFRWALTCSRMRLDGWGGGAHVLDLATGQTVEWLDCEDWLAERLAEAPAAPIAGLACQRVRRGRGRTPAARGGREPPRAARRRPRPGTHDQRRRRRPRGGGGCARRAAAAARRGHHPAGLIHPPPARSRPPSDPERRASPHGSTPPWRSARTSTSTSC